MFFPESVWAESRERQLTYYYAQWMNLILDYGNLSIAATDFFGSAKDAADKLSKKAGELKDDAGKQAEKLKESAKDAAGKAGQKASEVKESAGEKSKELQGKASEVQKQLSEKAGEAINKGGEAGKAAKEAAESTLGSLRAYFENIDTEKFERGWDYVSRIASSTLSAAQSQEVGNRIRAVQERIQVLEQDINLSAANARQAAQEKGFVFEKWHADTLNIDAAAKGFSDRAWAVGSNEYGSVDVATSYGENASLKAYKTGKDSAFEQSRRANAQSKKLWEGFQKKNQELAAGGNAPISLGEYVDQYVPDSEMKDIFVAKYSGQTRIIPSDQMEEAVKYLEGKIDKLSQDSGRKKR